MSPSLRWTWLRSGRAGPAPCWPGPLPSSRAPREPHGPVLACPRRRAASPRAGGPFCPAARFCHFSPERAWTSLGLFSLLLPSLPLEFPFNRQPVLGSARHLSPLLRGGLGPHLALGDRGRRRDTDPGPATPGGPALREPPRTPAAPGSPDEKAALPGTGGPASAGSGRSQKTAITLASGGQQAGVRLNHTGFPSLRETAQPRLEGPGRPALGSGVSGRPPECQARGRRGSGGQARGALVPAGDGGPGGLSEGAHRCCWASPGRRRSRAFPAGQPWAGGVWTGAGEPGGRARKAPEVGGRRVTRGSEVCVLFPELWVLSQRDKDPVCHGASRGLSCWQGHGAAAGALGTARAPGNRGAGAQEGPPEQPCVQRPRFRCICHVCPVPPGGGVSP